VFISPAKKVITLLVALEGVILAVMTVADEVVVTVEVDTALTTCNTVPAVLFVSIVPVTAGTVTVKLLAVFVGTSSMLPPLAAASLTPI
jgi:hypothetical protein